MSRGFEIGNHFCEWMYFNEHDKFPYFYHDSSCYPTREQQLNFIRAYIEETKKIRASGKVNCVDGQMDESDLDEEKILKEANYYALAAHIIAGLWGVHEAISRNTRFGDLVSLRHFFL